MLDASYSGVGGRKDAFASFRGQVLLRPPIHVGGEMEPAAVDIDPQRSTQHGGTLGTAVGTLEALLTFGGAGIGVVDSWRARERCSYAEPPTGLIGLSVESRPSLFPLGYQCIWGEAKATTAVTFANWPLTTVVLTGVSMVAIGGRLVARTRRRPRR